jgi:hypothetical protein
MNATHSRLTCERCHGIGYVSTALGELPCLACSVAECATDMYDPDLSQYICKTCGDGEWLPIYGVGPHRHTGKSFLGSTVLLPKEEWPASYREDPDAPGCGTWSCPDCDGHGVNARPRQELLEVVSNHQEMSTTASVSAGPQHIGSQG